ncbi:unnamed protein product, partial [Linum tenue]
AHRSSSSLYLSLSRCFCHIISCLALWSRMGSAAEAIPGHVSEPTIEIKIKTLDSQTYTLKVDKQISCLALWSRMGSAAEAIPGHVSEPTIEIKIKTLDSQTYTLKVDKQMPVPALKEQIASVTGVLSEQQRLICRGRVLKDDQLLSAY